MLKFKYALTNEGMKRCRKNEFYLQETRIYRGYTQKIFHLLYKSERPLTIREISNLTGIENRSVNGVLTFNIYAGYIRRIPL